MSAPEHPSGPSGDAQESDNDNLLEITFHYTDCPPPDEHVGVTFRRNRDGDIVPGSMTPFGIDEDATINAAITGAVQATGRRRQRVPPVRPPRPPRPIHAWDELLSGLATPFISPIERERQAAEITSPRNLDNEPDQTTWPIGWDIHHDYFLWSCRGTVEVITDHLQAVFAFDPPIEETFVAARLGGVNAYKQMTFLRKYLPGETHSLQRAEARGVLYEADISDPTVRGGYQELEVKQSDPEDPEYAEPVLPCWAPANWSRADDTFAAMYLGDHPSIFQREYGWVFDIPPSIEFIRIRMAQIPHMNINWMELQAAKSRRALLAHTCPNLFPDSDNNNHRFGFF